MAILKETEAIQRMQASISAFDRLYQRHGVEVTWAKHPPSVLTGEFAAMLMVRRPNPLVIDLGCGEGGKAFAIASYGVRVKGFDASQNAIAIARHQADELGLDGQVTFEGRDVTTLTPEGIGLADGVYDYQCINHIPKEQHARVVEIVSSLLPPGGVFLTNAFNKDTTNFYGEDMSQRENGEFIFRYDPDNPHHEGKANLDGMYCYFFTAGELLARYSHDYNFVKMISVKHPYMEGRFHWEALMVKK